MELIEITIFLSIKQLLLVGVIIFIGQFVYSAIGFGSGMVTVSLLALFIGDLTQFIPFYLLLCLPTEFFVSCNNRNKIKLQEIGKFLIFIFPMLFLGGYVLKNITSDKLVIFFGIIIVILSIYYIFFENSFQFRLQGMGWIALTGSLSGFLGGIYGISGPPLIFYFKAKRLEKKDFRITLLSIFLFTSLSRLLVFILFKLYSFKIIFSCLICLPFSILGLILGGIVHHKIPENHFKKITSFFLLVNGILLIAKKIFFDFN